VDFFALDVETANSNTGSICAIGLVKVQDGQVEEVFSSLTRPPSSLDYFEPMNVSIHGITPADVANAPQFVDVLDEVIKAIGDAPVVAHNAAFDMRALRQACDALGAPWPTLTYGCSLVFSRRLLSMLSYRLPFVCEELGIDLLDHHDASSDALASAEVTLELSRRTESSTLEELAKACGTRLGRLSPDSWSGCRRNRVDESGRRWDKPAISEAAEDADPDHPLYGQVLVFTGALGIPRQEAYDTVAALGATVKSGVSKKVTMLVIGDGFTGEDPSAFHTGKAADAAELMASGHQIEIIDERELMEMFAESSTSGRRA
jgi:DNA polymerase-3 subunit epsilon